MSGDPCPTCGQRMRGDWNEVVIQATQFGFTLHRASCGFVRPQARRASVSDLALDPSSCSPCFGNTSESAWANAVAAIAGQDGGGAS